MQFAVLDVFYLNVHNLLTGGKSAIVTVVHALFAKPVRVLAVAVSLLFFPYSWASAGTSPQVRQIYLKNDGANLQWKAVFDVDFNWDFNSDPDRGPTIEIFGLQGMPSGQSIESRIKLNSIPKAVTPYVTSVDRMGADRRWIEMLQFDGAGTVSGKETIGYISLSTLAKAGLSLPGDPSKLSYGNYYLYCGNNAACPGAGSDISGGAFSPLTAWDGSWQLVLDMDNPRTVMLTQAECLFVWAEKTYPQYFSNASGQPQTMGVYYYQQWAGSNSILGISTDKQRVLYIGSLSGGGMLDLGDLSTWLGTAGCK